jgi:hypothetical protein
VQDLFCIVRTRFSVRSGKWPGFVPDRSWLDFRFDLLSKCGAQAMQKQTFSSFVWLLEASPKTFPFLDERLRTLDLPFAHAVISPGNQKEGFPPLSESARALIPEAEWYLTVRVDSDDVLHPRTLEVFANSASETTPLVSVEVGYKFDWFAGDLFVHYYNSSAFLGLLSSDKSGFLGPAGHKNVRRYYNHVNFVDIIPFIQVVHGTNVRAGSVLDDEKIPGDKVPAVLEEYGVIWEPSVPAPTGESNPQVALRDWLQQTWRYKLRRLAQRVLRKAKQVM